jgi:hypothetical protein
LPIGVRPARRDRSARWTAHVDPTEPPAKLSRVDRVRFPFETLYHADLRVS